VQEVELAQMLDDLAADRALEGEVELLERLSGRKPRPLDPALAAEGTSAESNASAKRS
jgi:hypothetical protein